jgi:SAM-dependent methyltransferase
LAEFGFHPVVGVEPSRAAIESAVPEARELLREGMFTPELVADISPSLVCSFMTLEHLRDPGVFARMTHELLEPGGMIAVVVHNRDGLLNRVLGMKSPIIDIEHLQLFNPQSIKELLSQAGFEAIEVCSIWNKYPMRYWIRLTPLPPKLKNIVATMLEKTGLARVKLAAPVGNMLAVARKPSLER